MLKEIGKVSFTKKGLDKIEKMIKKGFEESDAEDWISGDAMRDE